MLIPSLHCGPACWRPAGWGSAWVLGVAGRGLAERVVSVPGGRDGRWRESVRVYVGVRAGSAGLGWAFGCGRAHDWRREPGVTPRLVEALAAERRRGWRPTARAVRLMVSRARYDVGLAAAWAAFDLYGELIGPVEAWLESKASSGSPPRWYGRLKAWLVGEYEGFFGEDEPSDEGSGGDAGAGAGR